MTRRDVLRNLVWIACPAVADGLSGGAGDTPNVGLTHIRVGISSSLLSGVNENDARAALKTWADTFSRETHVWLDCPPEVLSTPEQLFQRVRQRQVEVFSVLTSEYLQVAAYADPDLLFVDGTSPNGGEEYLILVHSESGFQRLGDLRGHSVIEVDGMIMSLAADWLEILLAGSNFGPADTFFSRITVDRKPSRAVLPVFFRQADACLVNRRGFEIMKEMNPQLATKLRAVETSPAVVPVIVAMRKNCTQEQIDHFTFALNHVGNTPAGRQILTLFGGHTMTLAKPAIVARSTDLVLQSARIRARRTATRK